MPNIANIDRLIGVFQADDGKHFAMGTWCNYLDQLEIDGHEAGENGRNEDRDVEKYEQCNTAFCLGGWIAWLRFLDEHGGTVPNGIELPEFNDGELIEEGAKWLGIERDQAHRLFMMYASDLSTFDTYPHGMRARAAIRVLELLKVDGDEHWIQALADTGMIADLDDDLQDYEEHGPQAD